MNTIVLLGNLTQEPTLHTVGKLPTAGLIFRIAVPRTTKDKIANRKSPSADFFTCECWNKTAEFVTQHFHKGDRILIQGSLHNAYYTDEDGTKHYPERITAERIYFADSKKQDPSEIPT